MNPFASFDIPDELPLEQLAPDGGFSRIFRRICCIGDSLSSGEFEVLSASGETQYIDVFEQSWGQYLARMTGATVFNLSRGGMTAREYWETFADSMGFWDRRYDSQAYLLALGVNDLFNSDIALGSVDDLNCFQPTFAGYYGRIVQRLREEHPQAKLFFITMPRSDQDTPEHAARRQAHADLLHEMADRLPGCYVIDLHRYAPVHDARFRSLYYLRGHLNPCGYVLTAQMVASYLDFIIRHHMEDFLYAGLIP